MKIYISLPITGYDLDERKHYADTVKRGLLLGGFESVTPFEVCPEPDKPYSYYMGRDIEALLECDCIYLTQGWQHSKGCRAERAVAEIYGIKVIDCEK